MDRTEGSRGGGGGGVNNLAWDNLIMHFVTQELSILYIIHDDATILAPQLSYGTVVRFQII
jgi:hypothetical protein